MAAEWVIEFPQPGDPVSENELKRSGFSGRGAYIGTKKKLDAWRDAAFYAWKQQRMSDAGGALGQPCTVLVEVGFHVARRRDPHNYVGTVVKSIVDGFVLAGLWPDDNPDWVEVLEPRLVIHERTPTNQALPCRVVLTAREEVNSNATV